MRIDLHTHSTASDGTTPPAVLMAEAQAAGLDVVALTDHDTTSGWQPAMDALPTQLTLVPGAEISCVWRPASDMAISLHVLAYLFAADHAEFRAARAAVRDSRFDRGERMVRQLNADGIDITWEEVLDYAAGAPVGRPHIGRALMAHGLVPDMDAAFAPEWLGRKYRAKREEIEIFHALSLITDAGGVAVLAHPKADKRGRTVPDSAIADFARAGLFGVEAFHTDHRPEQQAALASLAADLGLIATGASDFHGSNKKVRLGVHTTDVAAYERLVAAAHGQSVVRD